MTFFDRLLYFLVVLMSPTEAFTVFGFRTIWILLATTYVP